MISAEVMGYRLNNAKGRKIIIWGAGVIGKHLFAYFIRAGYVVDFFVDSDSKDIERRLCDIPVLDPSILKDCSHEYYIFVAIENVHQVIIDSLQEWGYKTGHDYWYITREYLIVNQISDYRGKFDNEIVGYAGNSNSTIVFRGAKNKLAISEGVTLRDTKIIFYGDNGYCHIDSSASYTGTIHIGDGCKVVIGKGLTVTGSCSIGTAENTEVIIGDDCMFAVNNKIWTHDYHPIYDRTTGERVNKSRSIHISNRVWLASEAIVLAGAYIEEGSMIGARSVVKSRIKAHSIAAGIPATVKRENIVWDRHNIQWLSLDD